MKCAFDKELLLEYAIGEIEPECRPSVDAHLAGCVSCRTEVVAHRQLARDLAGLPEPVFPSGLEDVLVRASIQAGRAMSPSRTVQEAGPRLRLYWAFGLGGLVGFGVLVLLVVLLWPGRITSWGPVDRVIGGEGGALGGLVGWFSELKAGWDITKEFMQKLAPVQRGVRIALGGVGGGVWAALALGAFGATFLLWRLTSAGQKKMRGIGHAKQQG